MNNKVFGLTEAGGGNPFVLLIREGHALTNKSFQGPSGGLVSRGKAKDLRHRSRQVHHRQLPFPGFAEPTFFRELLNVAGAFAARVNKFKRYPRPAGKDKRRNNEQE